MSNVLGPSDSHPVLPPQVSAVYRRVLRRERIDPGTPGISTAVQLGVVVPDPAVAGSYRAVDPSEATAEMVALETAKISAASDTVRRVPGMWRILMQIYQDEVAPVRTEIEHLHGNENINNRIEEVIDSAREELITAQPGGPRTPETLERSLGRDTAALERGITMRTLYHATARFSTHTQEWAKVMASRGGEIRTLDAPFLRMIIIDRKMAFIQDRIERGGDENERSWAHLVKDDALCAFLLAVFDRDWGHAEYWHGTPDGTSGLQTTSIQRAILRLLSDGKTQAQAAKSLGMSERTLQKNLLSLRERIPHLTSTPQMTYWWATCPDRLVD